MGKDGGGPCYTSVLFPSLALLRLDDFWRMTVISCRLDQSVALTAVSVTDVVLLQISKATGTLHVAIDMMNAHFSSCFCGKGIRNSSHSWGKDKNIHLQVCLRNMSTLFCNNIYNLKRSGHTTEHHSDPLH